jgi:excisionase family DNA binding protein
MNTHKTPPLSVPDDLPEVMDLQEASTYLRLKPRTLTRLATLGEVPAAKIGKQWRLHREALAKLFVPAGSQTPSDSV